jgi:hypothetical protein
MAPGGRLWWSTGRRLSAVDLRATLGTSARRRIMNAGYDPGRTGVGKVTTTINGWHADDVTKFRVEDGVVVTGCR